MDELTTAPSIPSASRQTIRRHLLRARAFVSNIETYNHANLFSLSNAPYEARKMKVNAQDKAQKPATETSPALPADQATIQHKKEKVK